MWVLGISLAHTGVRWRGVTIRTVGALTAKQSFWGASLTFKSKQEGR